MAIWENNCNGNKCFPSFFVEGKRSNLKIEQSFELTTGGIYFPIKDDSHEGISEHLCS